MTLPWDELPGLVRRAADGVDVGPPPTAAIVRRGTAHRRRSRIRTAAGAVALAVALPLLATGVARVAHDRSPRPAASITMTSPSPVVDTCSGPVPERVLPTWARTGFSDPEPTEPFVLGDRGDLLGVLFGQPLHAPPAKDRNNKILWVSRVSGGPGPLVIDATLLGTTVTAHREIDGGPGPSIVDLPRAGCWQLRLTWGPLVDTLRLDYAP